MAAKQDVLGLLAALPEPQAIQAIERYDGALAGGDVAAVQGIQHSGKTWVRELPCGMRAEHPAAWIVDATLRSSIGVGFSMARASRSTSSQ